MFKKSVAMVLSTVLSVSCVFSGCGKSHVHEYETVIKKYATCTTEGVKELTCLTCGKVTEKNYTASALTANEIYELSKETVGEIITYDKKGKELSLGSGFTYSEDGRIITNYHVIEGAYSAQIKIGTTTYPIQSILAYDKDIDLAVLKISADNLSVLSICEKEHAVGEVVYAFGSSQGLTSTFSQGIITCADRDMDGVHCVQHDAAISSGNSGGPLINQYGEVIGVNTMTITDSQNLNFAISTKELSSLKYTNPLSFAEFYEKESDVFTKIKNYIIQEGEYDREDNEYELNFGDMDSSVAINKPIGYYEIDENSITIALYYQPDSSSVGRMVFIDIDEIDGSYKWSYLDANDKYMAGILYASTWTADSLVGYSSTSGISSSLLSSYRQVASLMVSLLLIYFNINYAEIGVTAYDLGFFQFQN